MQLTEGHLVGRPERFATRSLTVVVGIGVFQMNLVTPVAAVPKRSRCHEVEYELLTG